jgi:hypothetical protein
MKHIFVLSVLILSPEMVSRSFAADDPQVDSLLSRLQADEVKYRQQAVADIINASATFSPAEREALLAGLVSLASAPARTPQTDESMAYPWREEWRCETKHLAMALLGDLRAKEGIHVLFGNLLYRNPLREGDCFTPLPELYYPSVRALIKIGEPALPKIREVRTATEDEMTRALCDYLLEQIEKRVKEEERARVLAESWGPVTEGFQLSVIPRKSTLGIDESILLDIMLANTTDEFHTAGWPLPKIELFNASGEPLPMIKRQREVLEELLNREADPEIALAPGPKRAWRHPMCVNNCYDISQPGEYTILVKWKVQTLDGKGTAMVESKPVNITVLPAEKVEPFPD